MPQRGSAWFRLHAQIDRARLSPSISSSLSLSKNTRIYLCIDTVSSRLSLVLLWILLLTFYMQSEQSSNRNIMHKQVVVGILTRLSDALHRKDV